MIIDTNTLKTKYWQHKRGTIGEVVTDINDIEQCIRNITSIIKGSVPFMNNLGCELMPPIGENSSDAIEYLRIIYLKEIPLQEPRCKIVDVTGVFNDKGKIAMSIYWKFKNDDITRKTEIYV